MRTRANPIYCGVDTIDLAQATKLIQSIAGGPKRMHSVIAVLCTGCELCIAPCPVDCIALIPAGRQWTAIDARAARERYAAWRARPGRRS